MMKDYSLLKISKKEIVKIVLWTVILYGARDFGSTLREWLKQTLFRMFSYVSNSQSYMALHANYRFDIIDG